MLIGFYLFWENYRLITADLSKQKSSDVDTKVIQKIIFTGKIKVTVANRGVMIYHIRKQSKETALQFSKRATKVLWI